jgi:hypothetical protein
MISRDFNTVTTLWSHLTGDENSNSSAWNLKFQERSK